MNRHQLQELARAHALYQEHLDHRSRLIAALNSGRLQSRPSALFSPSPRFHAVRGGRGTRALRAARADRLAKAA